MSFFTLHSLFLIDIILHGDSSALEPCIQTLYSLLNFVVVFFDSYHLFPLLSLSPLVFYSSSSSSYCCSSVDVDMCFFRLSSCVCVCSFSKSLFVRSFFGFPPFLRIHFVVFFLFCFWIVIVKIWHSITFFHYPFLSSPSFAMAIFTLSFCNCFPCKFSLFFSHCSQFRSTKNFIGVTVGMCPKPHIPAGAHAG